MALYNDRVYAFERMRALDPVLDQATSSQVSKFTDDDDRNHLAFLELTNYEKTGEFLYVHPLMKGLVKENEWEILRRTNPAEFTRQLLNAQKSIERYTSRINQKKYKSEQELADWQGLIETYTHKSSVMQKLLSK
ncbi:MAG TPA: hypothetical protein VFG54_12220 [Prolixibacteraceae bacterium]|nr:hypothetical protein [Prolixibacteraceae bacterium]